MRAVLLCALMGLSACQSTTELAPEQDNGLPYLDLTAEQSLKPESPYWQISKHTYPSYPVSAAKDGLSGCVKLAFGINTQGQPEGYKVVASYPPGVFDQKAAQALSQWRWGPGANNSQRQPVFTQTQLDFMVEGAKNLAEAEENCGYQHNRRF
ncbi:energy transducer TonB [Bowmanella pacifica]|uniref:TonB C-terminal domain-containing protein n=1 Tax=Bowmanella pacifica TaxID=502051 RepID=A0A917YY37_9ALTE|nr:energy transducer TonB [Bowmanella pacifica]GGO67654.1 hypothetical protein GCM10010982_14630 [Bowmanella pacifica]